MAVLSKFNKLNGTSLASFHKILFIFIISSFLSFASVEAQVDVATYLYQNCSTNTTTVNSAFQFDLKTLLSSLSSSAIGDTQFYRTKTVNGRNPSEPIYGLFMCRGDVSPQLCQYCVQKATQQLSSDPECSLSKQAVIWYDECMVRYSNGSFFSTVDTTHIFLFANIANVSNQESFMRVLFATMNETAYEASDSLIGNKKYATKDASISEFQSLYCLAQCTDDLSPQNCRRCLSSAIGLLPEGKQGGRVLVPSCNIRYEFYPFFRNLSDITPPKFISGTKSFLQDSESTEDPVYLHHNCSTKKTLTATDDMYLTTLLSYLSSNATYGSTLFYRAEITYMKYGLFMCRGDLPFHLCGQCVQNASNQILSNSECRSSQEGIIWYSHCLLRYSDQSFFSEVDKSPIFSMLNITNTSDAITEQNFYTSTLSNTLAKLAIAAGDSNERYLTESTKLNDLEVLYTLAQCTQDLSNDQCKGCLQDVIGMKIPWSRLGSVGGRVMYPSCNLRFELFQFYRNGSDQTQSTGQESPPPPRPPPPLPEKRKGQTRKILLIVIPTIMTVMLCSFGYYTLNIKARKSRKKTILQENFGDDIATLEPLQFSLAVIKVATNGFSDENKIGKGGFGEVYKGIFLDGRQIAVKRLSKSSKQGTNEFKNEVLSIAKLQHRNLVAFIGFCLEEQEKILIYEYVTNNSLDYFLFDSQRQGLLSWSKRYNIVRGIARGILYLHEQSRLKVIHRDLKPSNILLDENMIPKISDFGLARIVDINEDHGSTKRIAGTHGYMSPEYALLGQYSEKSDVFSFGVMVLEIITGKKNISSNQSHSVADGLLIHVWRQWRNQTPLSILDTNILDNYNETEVIKCIQIGLLCVQQDPIKRPAMIEIVSYLSSHLIELPTPQEPAFYHHDRRDLQTAAQSVINASTPISINKVSISEFLPR